MSAGRGSWREAGSVWIVVIWTILLHACFFVSAGALWRDEANSIQQALLPDWNALWSSIRYDSFPALFPAILRLWSVAQWGATDHGLRVLGIVVGLTILASIWGIARLWGASKPAIVLLMSAANPVLIAEADSVRPYGISLLFLLWFYGALGCHLAKRSSSWLVAASGFALLAVQSSYTNALFVAALIVCAAASAAWRDGRLHFEIWLAGAPAAISLTPYWNSLQVARSWSVILDSGVSRLHFLRVSAGSDSWVWAAAWILAVVGTTAALRFSGRSDGGSRDASIRVFALSAAVLALAGQIAFLQYMGVPPFPRYFLVPLTLAAFALELGSPRQQPAFRTLVVFAVLILTAFPSWTSLRRRHTNIDGLAAIVEVSATPRDLVILAPWFLHTSFQRYYRGPAEWITLPELAREPIMRYDRIRDAMRDGTLSGRLAARIRARLADGGKVWLVSQRLPVVQPSPIPREFLVSSDTPNGSDYARLLLLWERDLAYDLGSCCRCESIPAPAFGPAWSEELLHLTRWTAKETPIRGQ